MTEKPNFNEQKSAIIHHIEKHPQGIELLAIVLFAQKLEGSRKKRRSMPLEIILKQLINEDKIFYDEGEDKYYSSQNKIDPIFTEANQAVLPLSFSEPD